MEIARQKAYRKTFDLACATLAGLSVEEQAAKAGLSLSKQGDAYVISVPSFDETIELAVPGFSFTSTKGSNITLTAKIIILHYLINASGMPLGAGLVPYEDVRGCRSYLPVFERRVVKPLLNAFGFARDAFNDAGSALVRQAGRIRQRLFHAISLPKAPHHVHLMGRRPGLPTRNKSTFRQINRHLRAPGRHSSSLENGGDEIVEECAQGA